MDLSGGSSSQSSGGKTVNGNSGNTSSQSSSSSSRATPPEGDTYTKAYKPKVVTGLTKEYVENIISTNKSQRTNQKKDFPYIKVDYHHATENDWKENLNNDLEKLKKDWPNTSIADNAKPSLEKVYEVLKTTIVDLPTMDYIEDIIFTLKQKRDESQAYYGVFDNGELGTKENPAPGSLYYNVAQAENIFNNDAYSKQTAKINELQNIQDNIEELNQYNEFMENHKKDTSIEKNPNLFDTNKFENIEDNEAFNALQNDVSNEKNKRHLGETIPQTVHDMLGFIYGMKLLTREYPYYLQTVQGLDEAYKKYFEIKDPYMGSSDGKITINCWESLDLRITSMFNKYFNAVYDRQYRRERVPINLRRFNCSIFVHDIRNFKDSTNGLKVSGDLSTMALLALNYMSVIEFKFFDCEIVPSETGNLFDNVSNNSAGDMRSTNFTFTYGNCVINFFPFDDVQRYLIKSFDPESNDNTYKKEDIMGYQSGDNDVHKTDEDKKSAFDEYINNNSSTDDSIRLAIDQYNGTKKVFVEDTEEGPGLGNAHEDEYGNFTNNLTKKYSYPKEKIEAYDVYDNDLYDDQETKLQKDMKSRFDLGYNTDNYWSFKKYYYGNKDLLGNVNTNDNIEFIDFDRGLLIDKDLDFDIHRDAAANEFAINSLVNQNSNIVLNKLFQSISASTGMPLYSVPQQIITNLGNINDMTSSVQGNVGSNINPSSNSGMTTDLGNVNDGNYAVPDNNMNQNTTPTSNIEVTTNIGNATNLGKSGGTASAKRENRVTSIRNSNLNNR